MTSSHESWEKWLDTLFDFREEKYPDDKQIVTIGRYARVDIISLVERILVSEKENWKKELRERIYKLSFEIDDDVDEKTRHGHERYLLALQHVLAILDIRESAERKVENA